MYISEVIIDRSSAIDQIKLKEKLFAYTLIPSFQVYSIPYRFPLTFFSSSLYPQPPPFLAVTTEPYS